jgi:hypothetical protein
MAEVVIIGRTATGGGTWVSWRGRGEEEEGDDEQKEDQEGIGKGGDCSEFKKHFIIIWITV